MVDFKNKTFFKLKAIDNKEGEKIVSDILIPNEKVFASFGALRDKLVFTDKRIISIILIRRHYNLKTLQIRKP